MGAAKNRNVKIYNKINLPTNGAKHAIGTKRLSDSADHAISTQFRKTPGYLHRAADMLLHAGKDAVTGEILDGSVTGKLLMAPMGLNYKKLFIDEDGHHKTWRDKILSCMISWQYFSVMVIVTIMVVVTYFIKRQHDTISEDDVMIDPTPAWVEYVDFTILAVYIVDALLRMVGQGFWQYLKHGWNWLDMALILIDVTLSMMEYWWFDDYLGANDDASPRLKVQILRNFRILRALRLIEVYQRVKTARRRTFVLREVMVVRSADDLGLEVRWMGLKQKKICGPLLINVDPDSPSAPATVLDKYMHIVYLKTQSPFCFKVPARSLEEPPSFVGYLQVWLLCIIVPMHPLAVCLNYVLRCSSMP